ncbi:MAG: hypothetical protein NTW19_16840, partial [Planctomycetota bacterium]|nr:hypothetical protein [Planctomycetota bacterium]
IAARQGGGKPNPAAEKQRGTLRRPTARPGGRLVSREKENEGVIQDSLLRIASIFTWMHLER